jgi:hypothetical protein
MRQKTERHQYAAERTIKDIRRALSEQNSKYLARPSNRSDRPGKMQENQWPQNPVLTFWQSKRICSDNAANGAGLRRSGCKLTPLNQGGRAVLFEDVAGVEVAAEVEVIVD